MNHEAEHLKSSAVSSSVRECFYPCTAITSLNATLLPGSPCDRVYYLRRAQVQRGSWPGTAILKYQDDQMLQ